MTVISMFVLILMKMMFMYPLCALKMLPAPANNDHTAINGEVNNDGQPDADTDNPDNGPVLNGEVTKVEQITRNNKGRWYKVRLSSC